MQKPITIASRQSPLAVAQAELVRALLGRAAGIDEASREAAFPIRTYVTMGDKNLKDSLSEVGGKGLFVKEIEAALLSGEANIAVHSMKDMPAEMPAGLMLAAVPKREDPRDAFVSLDGGSIEDLAEGATVGTSSVRRAAQLRRRRPDLRIVPFRGNVQTRLQKLEDGVADGTFLAEAGLRRLGRNDVARRPIEPEMMLPAPSQGTLCIQTRTDKDEAYTLCRKVNCETSELLNAVERAFVASLDGSCRTPMAGLATLLDEEVLFQAEILHPDGSIVEAHRESAPLAIENKEARLNAAHALGTRTAEALLGKAPEALKGLLTHA